MSVESYDLESNQNVYQKDPRQEFWKSVGTIENVGCAAAHWSV